MPDRRQLGMAAMTDESGYELQLTAMRTVMEALKPLNEIGREAVLAWVDSQLGRKHQRNQAGEASPAAVSAPIRQGTVSVVAQKIGAKSARDLLLAAAAHLTLYQGKDSFSKDDLVACAKDARNWKADYSNQMASNMKRMLDAGTLFEKAKNLFSLSSDALADIEERLSK